MRPMQSGTCDSTAVTDPPDPREDDERGQYRGERGKEKGGEGDINKEQGTRNQRRTGAGSFAARNKQQATGSRQPAIIDARGQRHRRASSFAGTENGERGGGVLRCEEQATGDRQPATGNHRCAGSAASPGKFPFAGTRERGTGGAVLRCEEQAQATGNRQPAIIDARGQRHRRASSAREQRTGTGAGSFAARNKQQATGNRQPRHRCARTASSRQFLRRNKNGERGAGSAARNRQQATGNRQPAIIDARGQRHRRASSFAGTENGNGGEVLRCGTGNRQPATGNRQPAIIDARGRGIAGQVPSQEQRTRTGRGLRCEERQATASAAATVIQFAAGS